MFLVPGYTGIHGILQIQLLYVNMFLPGLLVQFLVIAANEKKVSTDVQTDVNNIM